METDRYLAENLKRIRLARKLSLDELAARTGISKSMLGQIERGVSNPSVTTLNRLVQGLHVSYEEILCPQEDETEIIKTEELAPVKEKRGKYRIYSFIPYERHRRFEQVIAEISAGQVMGRIKEDEAVAEYAVVLSGELFLRIGTKEYELSQGDAIRIPIGTERVYCNRTENVIRVLVTLSKEEW